MTGQQETGLLESIDPRGTRVSLASVWVLLTVLGLVGNTLVILSVIFSRKLRTVTNVFVVNLSVADLWTTLSYPWMAVALLSQDAWPMESEAPCIIAAVQLLTGLGTRMYSLAAIALNRMILTTQSEERYGRLYSPGKVIGMVATTWLVPFIVICLPPILKVGALGYDPQDKTCSDKDSIASGTEYNLIQFGCLYLLPFSSTVISYTALYIIQKKRRGDGPDDPNSDELDAPGGEVSSHIFGITDTSSETLRSSRDRLEQAITKTLFVLFCVFILLVSPYFISLAVLTSVKFAVYGMTIAILNSCVNPIIYTADHPHFKLVLRKMIRCRYSEIPQPSYCLESLCRKRGSQTDI